MAITLLESTSKVALCFRRRYAILEGFFYADLSGCLDRKKKTLQGILSLWVAPQLVGCLDSRRVLFFLPQKQNTWSS